MKTAITILFSSFLIFSCRVFAQDGAVHISKSTEPAAEQASQVHNEQLLELETLSKKIAALSAAVVDLNKKNSELQNEVDLLQTKLNALTLENQNAKLQAKKNLDNYASSAEEIKAQKNKIDELVTQLRLVEKTMAYMQERQSVGEYSIKKDYSREAEKTKRSAKLINVLAISVALLAVVIAL